MWALRVATRRALKVARRERLLRVRTDPNVEELVTARQGGPLPPESGAAMRARVGGATLLGPASERPAGRAVDAADLVAEFVEPVAVRRWLLPRVGEPAVLVVVSVLAARLA
jgi:hypothetical protein